MRVTRLLLGPELSQFQMDVHVFMVVDDGSEDEGDDLADNGGDGRALRAHVKADGHFEQAHVVPLGQYEDGIEDDVDDRARALGDHRVERAPRGLHQPLEDHLAKEAEGTAAHHRQVVHAVLHDGHVVRLREHEGAAAEDAEEQKDDVAHQREEHAMLRHAVGPLAVARAQSARQKRVDAHRRARGQADHQVLRRKAEGHRRERLLADHADKDAVHDVVKRLHQHRDHQRHRHVQHQFADGHDAHFVLGCVFHGDPFHSLVVVCRGRGAAARHSPPIL